MRFSPGVAVLVTCVFLGLGTAAWAAGPSPDAAPVATAPAASPDSAVPIVTGSEPSPSAGSEADTRPTPDAFGSTGSASKSHPLDSTPSLGPLRYVFPVVGAVSFGDSYGAPRSDLPDEWHHGDDIFASLGAPVVAVADGTVDKIGWNRIGGWRLWLHDTAGNAFYYAHLSAYAPAVLHGSDVKAGQVLGFIGDTGDAITTPYHLHFEVHPAVYRHLGEDGAVDPTTYLWRWRHLKHVETPRPALPSVPGGAVGYQAEQAYQQLLSDPSLRQALEQTEARARAKARARTKALAAQRHKSAPTVKPRPLLVGISAPARVSAPTGAQQAVVSAPTRAEGSTSGLTIAGIAVGGLAALIAVVAFACFRSDRRFRWLQAAPARVRSKSKS